MWIMLVCALLACIFAYSLGWRMGVGHCAKHITKEIAEEIKDDMLKAAKAHLELQISLTNEKKDKGDK